VRRRICVVVLCLSFCCVSRPAAAFVIVDIANIFRQALTAGVKDQIIQISAKTNAVMDTMSTRLRELRDMRDYAAGRVAGWLDVPLSYVRAPLALTSAFMQTLQTGRAFVDSVRYADIDPRHTYAGGPVHSALVSLDLASSVLTQGMEVSGRIRAYGPEEAAGITRLERDVTGTGSGSATEALDTLTGAALIRARQQETRGQLTSTLVETLVVEGIRDRQTDAASAEMQMGLLRYRQAREDGGENWSSGAEDVLAWRQP
jgi:hypothetical protein